MVMTVCLPLNSLDVVEADSIHLEIDNLQKQLLDSCNERMELEALALESLNLPILFLTGSHTITERGMVHVSELIEFLRDYPRYRVCLHGHADPRGEEEYNFQLSMLRAKSVSEALVNGGVAKGRVEIHPCGAKESLARQGDMLGYAHERRVDVGVIAG